MIEKAFYWLLYGVCITFVSTVLIFFFMPAKVTFYSLSDNGGSSMQGIRIQKHINWAADDCIRFLIGNGSVASPGYMKPEGVVVWHTAANIGFKKTIDKDEIPKSLQKNQ